MIDDDDLPDFMDFVGFLFNLSVMFFIAISIPLWIIPFGIYKLFFKKRG